MQLFAGRSSNEESQFWRKTWAGLGTRQPVHSFNVTRLLFRMTVRSSYAGFTGSDTVLLDQDFIKNFKILQTAFDKKQISRVRSNLRKFMLMHLIALAFFYWTDFHLWIRSTLTCRNWSCRALLRSFTTSNSSRCCFELPVIAIAKLSENLIFDLRLFPRAHAGRTSTVLDCVITRRHKHPIAHLWYF